MDIQQALAKIVDRQDLSEAQMLAVMEQIMTGQADAAQIGGFLVALRMKGESLDEITGAARVMRKLSTGVEVNTELLVDTCGTGGDGANLFNVSTAAAFVAAAAGARVAKHGNRSVSSSTGSADVLEAAGVDLSMSAETIARAIDTVGLGFMFAPAHHSAMKHAIGPRKALGLRSIFNVLGPLTNPAGVRRQVIGVYHKSLCLPIAKVLARLGSEHVMVVHSDDGLDELSIVASSTVAELKDGQVREYALAPAEFGLHCASIQGLGVTSAADSLKLIGRAFAGERDEIAQRAAKMISLNAGAAIYVSGAAGSMKEGVAMAEDAIGTGAAAEKVKALVEFSQCR